MKVILLIGPPGSGKSSITTSHFSSYARISQDVLGSRALCIYEMKEALRKNQNVIVDRCNMTIEQRSHWISLALEFGAESIVGILLDVHPEECLARVDARKSHQTILPEMSLDKKRQIVYNFTNSFEVPQLSEGFSSIVVTRN